MIVTVAVDFSVTVYLNLSTEHPSSCSVVPAVIFIAKLQNQVTVESNCN